MKKMHCVVAGSPTGYPVNYYIPCRDTGYIIYTLYPVEEPAIYTIDSQYSLHMAVLRMAGTEIWRD